MSYFAELSSDAFEELDSFPLSSYALATFLSRLQEFATAPLGLHQRADYLFRDLDARVYKCEFAEGKKRHYFSVYFHFHEDEKRLVVSHIGYALE